MFSEPEMRRCAKRVLVNEARKQRVTVDLLTMTKAPKMAVPIFGSFCQFSLSKRTKSFSFHTRARIIVSVVH